MEALAVFPVPAFVDVTLPEVLLYVVFDPLAVILSEKTQGVPFATVPPENDTVPLAAVGDHVAEPQPDWVGFGDGATVIPDGIVSLSATPVSANALPLVIVKVSDVVPPAKNAGPNVLDTAGAIGVAVGVGVGDGVAVGVGLGVGVGVGLGVIVGVGVGLIGCTAGLVEFEQATASANDDVPITENSVRRSESVNMGAV